MVGSHASSCGCVSVCEFLTSGLALRAGLGGGVGGEDGVSGGAPAGPGVGEPTDHQSRPGVGVVGGGVAFGATPQDASLPPGGEGDREAAGLGQGVSADAAGSNSPA